MTKKTATATWFACFFSIFAFACHAASENNIDYTYFKHLITEKSPHTGAYVLEKGEESLISRAWLADHAKVSIEVQYFIWSSDNIGILAAEALLRAAERGVTVRVIVDDLLIDAPDQSLLALAKHPNIQIKIYNPKHSVGTPLHKRVFNMFTGFRSFNQRMHNKTFIVDGVAAITGGRNMADEYYDFDHQYNFRDRDVLLLGDAAGQMSASFEQYWQHPISVSVEQLYDGLGIMQKNVSVDNRQIETVYGDLHAYANDRENYAPEIRQAVEDIPSYFPKLIEELEWCKVDIISDLPGKNASTFTLGGGGQATQALAKLIQSAKHSIIIQSPYLVMTDEAILLFGELLRRGVSIKISTNSLSSTDNLPAFSGYKSQREELLALGMEIFEYKSAPVIQTSLMERRITQQKDFPVFALHAKTMVIDKQISYIGTFNLDPRSINLNTEIGAIIHSEKIASQVTQQILNDMLPENSWNAASEDADKHNSFWKRSKTLFWQLMPIEPLL
ncbi:MAG: phospholipase D family protein [Gammaproteobacteria bacterium]|nr:phospholipase D family protein [Gammaproteobacteria bacterium]